MSTDRNRMFRLLAALCFVFVAVVMAAAISSAAPPLLRDDGSGARGNPSVLPPGSSPYGKTYGEWSAAWWKWALELPFAGHPFNDDPGFNVAAGQSGDVWFLAGVFGTVSRNVVIPNSKALFVGLLNAEASDLEGLGATEAERRATAEWFADHIVTSTLFCTIDGVAVGNLSSYRASSPEFSFTAPTPWIMGATGGAGLSVGDGYYLMLAPLSVGTHTIRFGGAFHFAIAEGDPFDADFGADDTYYVTAQ